MNIKKTVINGNVVAENGQTLLKRQPCKIVNHFHVQPKRAIDFRISPKGDKIRVIEVNDGQLLTKKGFAIPKVVEGNVVSDGLNDILKCAVANRYKHQKPAIGFAHGFKLSRGAMASSISHDSHHIVAIGVTDEEICMAVNTVIQHRGGLCVVSKGENLNKILPLPIAGLMSAEDYSTVSQRFAEVNAAARSIGSELHSPFMTLSFLPLLVIPELRLCHRGLFDVEKFELVDLFLSV